MEIEVSFKPRKIVVTKEDYNVGVFIDGELVSVLPLCYNSYEEALMAIKNKLKECSVSKIID